MSISIWRDAGVTPKVLGIPCIAYTPIFLWLFHMRMWTAYTAVGVIVVYAILAKFGWTLRVMLGKLQHFLRGSRVLARPWWWRSRFSDR